MSKELTLKDMLVGKFTNNDIVKVFEELIMEGKLPDEPETLLAIKYYQNSPFYSNSTHKWVVQKREEICDFILSYKTTEIGRLLSPRTLTDGNWAFLYSESFGSSGLEPIANFPNPGEIYRSERLFPYFRGRVPPLGRVDILNLTQDKKTENEKYIALLQAFPKCITDPFIIMAIT